VKTNVPPVQVKTEPIYHSAPKPTPSGPPAGSRRSTRATAGLRQTTRYADAFKVATFAKDDGYQSTLAYKAELQTDLVTGHVDIQDPRVYAAKKKEDPDEPTLYQALHGEHAEQYMEAMKKEMQSLIQQSTWKTIPQTEAKKVIKSTWVFKLKRFPDGSPSKFKARFCVRGDLQTEGVDYFETYAPVVQWSTVRLLLTLVLREGWATRQVDYTNASAQAEMQEEVYVEPPKLFATCNGTDRILKLLKSLYGLKQAPKTFYEKLSAGLKQRGFIQPKHDTCLFLKQDLICVIYVDDTIFSGPDKVKIAEEIAGLGVSKYET
jgi:hypothetical protein